MKIKSGPIYPNGTDKPAVPPKLRDLAVRLMSAPARSPLTPGIRRCSSQQSVRPAKNLDRSGPLSRPQRLAPAAVSLKGLMEERLLLAFDHILL